MGQLGAALGDIKISHTLFALPMALTGMLLATGGTLPASRVLLPILLCMAAGRTAAMSWNRVVDAAIDARNPRTAGRAIPRGAISSARMAVLATLSAAAFVAGAALLNGLTLALAPLALATFATYPYTKRFTLLCHFILGLALGAAPLGAWIAVRGRIELPPLLLGVAVLLWVAGFDILYALQDEGVDLREALHSLPAALGGRRARWVARAAHAGMIVLLLSLGAHVRLGGLYYAAVGTAGILVATSHWLVREGISRIHTAFFTLQSWVSVVILLGTIAGIRGA